MKKKRRHWWRWGALGTVMIIVAVLVTGWLMFQHIPSWYRPVEIPPEQLQAVRDELVLTQDALNVGIVTSGAPFEHRFTQDHINALLAAREDIWPRSRDWLPRSLVNPFIAITPEGVRLGATYDDGSLQCVVSAHLALEANRDRIRVRLIEVAGGSLSVPQDWVRRQLAAMDEGDWPAGERAENQYGPGQLPALAGLFEGVDFPNGWLWPEPRRPFRIIGLRLEPGVAVVTIEPLSRQASSDVRFHKPSESP